MDGPPEALPKFGAHPPIKRPRMIFVAADSGVALPKFSARLPIKRTRMIFVAADSAEAEVSQAVEGSDAGEDGAKANPVAVVSGLVATVITTVAEGEDWVVANSSRRERIGWWQTPASNRTWLSSTAP